MPFEVAAGLLSPCSDGPESDKVGSERLDVHFDPDYEIEGRGERDGRGREQIKIVHTTVRRRS